MQLEANFTEFIKFQKDALFFRVQWDPFKQRGHPLPVDTKSKWKKVELPVEIKSQSEKKGSIENPEVQGCCRHFFFCYLWKKDLRKQLVMTMDGLCPRCLRVTPRLLGQVCPQSFTISLRQHGVRGSFFVQVSP